MNRVAYRRNEKLEDRQVVRVTVPWFLSLPSPTLAVSDEPCRLLAKWKLRSCTLIPIISIVSVLK
jgi:hypothetical protein